MPGDGIHPMVDDEDDGGGGGGADNVYWCLCLSLTMLVASNGAL